MATDPALKLRIAEALREQPQGAIEIVRGYAHAMHVLGLDGVSTTAFKRALNSMAFKPGEQYLMRVGHGGCRSFRLLPT